MVDTDPTNTNTLYKEVTIMLIIMMKSAMYFILHEIRILVTYKLTLVHVGTIGIPDYNVRYTCLVVCA